MASPRKTSGGGAQSRSGSSRKTTTGSMPMYYATAGYKRWLRRQLDAWRDPETRKKMSFRELAERIEHFDTRFSASSSSVSQFLGPLEDPAPPSNTEWMPAINHIFGIAPPPLCDPDDEVAELQNRLASRWRQLTETDREILAALLRDRR